jgi:hypothetical protein
MKMLLCRLGISHDWDDCHYQCRRCREWAPRPHTHDWDGCICRRCGTRSHWPEDPPHDWDGCICRKCGAKNRNANASQHDWDGCTCRQCNKTAHGAHLAVRGGSKGKQIIESSIDPIQAQVEQMVEAIFTPAHTNSLETLLNEPFTGTFHQTAADR